MVVPHRHLQIVVQNDAYLPHRCRGSSAQTDTDLPSVFGLKNGGNQKAYFVRNNNAEGSRKTSQESIELSL